MKRKLTKQDRIVIAELRRKYGDDVADDTEKTIIEQRCIRCGYHLDQDQHGNTYCLRCDVLDAPSK